jgi:[ribosomal protein S5]-alanine N-acetyltransferase
MQLFTGRLILKVPSEAEAQALFDFYQKNRSYLKKWFVDQPEDVYELLYIAQNLEKSLQKHKESKEVKFFIFLKENPGKLAGELNFSNIIMGGFLSCCTGYHLDEHLQGKGIMTEALNAGVSYMFAKKGLHRIEANIMPDNIASQRVAIKAGFYKEGISARYLRINGRWEDHQRYVTFNPAME